MSKQQTVYVVMMAHELAKSIQLESGAPCVLTGLAPKRYLPVFDSHAAAIEWGAEPHQIQEATIAIREPGEAEKR